MLQADTDISASFVFVNESERVLFLSSALAYQVFDSDSDERTETKLCIFLY